jgi:hypothetical protein
MASILETTRIVQSHFGFNARALFEEEMRTDKPQIVARLRAVGIKHPASDPHHVLARVTGEWVDNTPDLDRAGLEIKALDKLVDAFAVLTRDIELEKARALVAANPLPQTAEPEAPPSGAQVNEPSEPPMGLPGM